MNRGHLQLAQPGMPGHAPDGHRHSLLGVDQHLGAVLEAQQLQARKQAQLVSAWLGW
jgi:hypothetical protein